MRTFLFYVSALVFVGSMVAGISALIPQGGYSLPNDTQSSDTTITVCIVALILSCIGLAKTSLQMKINKG